MGRKATHAGHASSGWVVPPPITREEASAAYGAEIGAEAWAEIEEAFARFGSALDDLKAPRLNANPNDPRSFTIARQSAVADLEAAFHAIERIRSDHDFCQTGSEAATGTQDGAEALGDALDGASKQLFIALQILDRADPKPVVHISEPEARRRLARDIAEALRAEGLAVEMRGGGTWDKLGPDETEADLTPFGRLVLELKIHKTQSISGLNQFVRLALKDAGSN